MDQKLLYAFSGLSEHAGDKGLESDTLVFDTARIAAWQSDGRHRYAADAPASDFDLMGWLTRWLNHWLDSMDPSGRLSAYSDWFWLGLLGLLLVGLALFLFWKRPRLFIRSRRYAHDEASEENIHQIDFQNGKARALASGDYREAIRLLYLWQLKQFADAGLLAWQPYKTPSQYLRELSGSRWYEPFRRLNWIFLRVRYGNFKATEQLYHEAEQCFQHTEPGQGGAV